MNLTIYLLHAIFVCVSHSKSHVSLLNWFIIMQNEDKYYLRFAIFTFQISCFQPNASDLRSLRIAKPLVNMLHYRQAWHLIQLLLHHICHQSLHCPEYTIVSHLLSVFLMYIFFWFYIRFFDNHNKILLLAIINWNMKLLILLRETKLS